MNAWRRLRGGRLPLVLLLMSLAGCGETNNNNNVNADTTNGRIQLNTTSVAFEVAQNGSLADETRSITATHSGDFVLVGIETSNLCGPAGSQECFDARYDSDPHGNPVAVSIYGQSSAVDLPAGRYTVVFRFNAMRGVSVLGYQDVTVNLAVN